MSEAPLTPLDPEAVRQLDGFIDKFDDEVAANARAMLDRMRRRIPGAAILVYDNYNALAIGFGPNEKAGQAVLSLAVFPRWVTLCLLWGVDVPDPHGLLKGGGSRVRHVRLPTPETLDDPRIDTLVSEALVRTNRRFDPEAPQRLIIKAVSAKQRPRRA